MSIRGFFSQSLRILAEPHIKLIDPSPAQQAESARWSRAAWLLGVVVIAWFLLFWFTRLLPDWTAYVVAPLGLAARLCQVQAQECLRVVASPKMASSNEPRKPEDR